MRFGKKIILFFSIIAFSFSLIGVAQMQTPTQINYDNKTGEQIVEIEEQLAAEEIAQTFNARGQYKPKIMPGTVFYPLKNFFREAQVLLSQNTDQKINLRLRYANEKILELNTLADSGQMAQVAKNLENYSTELIKIGQLIGKTAGQNPQKAEELSKKMLKNQINHQIIGNKFEREAPIELLTDIRASKDKVISTVGSVISNLGSEDKIQKTIDEDVKKMISKGTPYRQMHALSALKTVAEILPPEAQKAVNAIDEKYTKNLNIDLDRMNPSYQEKFVQYASANSGDDVVQMEILDDLSVTNTNDRSYKNIDKAKINVYKNFNNKLSAAESKAPEAVNSMINRLENGDIRDLRVIQEMEQNINTDLVKKIITKTKNTSLENLSNRLVKEDEKIFSQNVGKTADLKQLAVLNEIEKKISIVDRPKLEKARGELIKKLDYSVTLTNPEMQDANVGAIPSTKINQTDMMIANCIAEKKCFNVRNINPEDTKIINENRTALGQNLSDKLQEINRIRVVDSIKNADNIETLRKLEMRVKNNLPPETIATLKDEFTNQTVIINNEAINTQIRPLPPVYTPPQTPVSTTSPTPIKPTPPITTTPPITITCNLQEFSPVCGTDGNNYRNRCVAEKIVKIIVKHEGLCLIEKPLPLPMPVPTPEPTSVPMPPTSIQPSPIPPTANEDNSITCAQEYAPVCGSDGKTYANRCVAEKIARVIIKYIGKCAEQSYDEIIVPAPIMEPVPILEMVDNTAIINTNTSSLPITNNTYSNILTR